MKTIKRCSQILSKSKGKIIKKIGQILEAIDHYTDLLSRITHVEADMSQLQRQLTAIQAIDQDWHTEGKIIVMAHVNSKDWIKIIPMRPKLTSQEYMELVKRLELQYGAKPEFVDSIMPSKEWKGHYNGRF